MVTVTGAGVEATGVAEVVLDEVSTDLAVVWLVVFACVDGVPAGDAQDAVVTSAASRAADRIARRRGRCVFMSVLTICGVTMVP